MTVVTIVATGDEPDTFVVEMATDIGSVVIHVSVPATIGGRPLSPEQRLTEVRKRVRALAIDVLANVPLNGLH